MTAIDDFGGWPALLTMLLDRTHLTADQAHAAMATILGGDATPAQLIGFVVALRSKGESAEELSGLLDAVLEAAELVPLSEELRASAIDIVGTGGDRACTINASTVAALVVAGAGVPVCKHGARAASSKCGTADVLEALGVVVELTPNGVLQCVERAGIGFCLAPRFHPAFRFAAPSRREIGIPTVFNLLGPMANPGRVRRQLIGVANPAYAERMLQSLRHHGSTHAWVVHGNGLDELSTTGPSSVLALRDGEVEHFEIDATSIGLPVAVKSDFTGGEPAENATAVRRVLAGERGPHRDIVVLNAAAALIVAGHADSLAAGADNAAETIDSGRASAMLDAFVRESRAAADAAADG
jgi:anthranilate phosphoribosyltransferase